MKLRSFTIVASVLCAQFLAPLAGLHAAAITDSNQVAALSYNLNMVHDNPGEAPFDTKYISTGSLYLCSAGLLPPGVPTTDEFWSAPAERWTSQKL